MRLLSTCLLLGAVSTAAIAQDQPNTILVLDGSGSMWGQIDGVAKITIAQEVVSGLLADFPADQGLGLTVYGHRERGNCTDIETIVAPATGTVEQIVAAVNGIKPLGKTPMTDAVIAAAQALRYTEDSATVILVSDGVETCNPDPCAAARLLEEAGIDFTTHVVGFDVSDPEALAQMQCIADETGGQFLTASNADELDLAMTAMVMEPEPEPEPVMIEMTFTAVIGDDKTLIDTPVLWDIDGQDGNIVASMQANPYLHELDEGPYTATAYSIAAEETGRAQFVVIDGGATTVEIVFEKPPLTARLIAPETAVAGEIVQIGWDGPALDGDYLGVGAQDATGAARWQNFAYTTDGNPLELLMPTQPGDYLIRYFLGENREVIAEVPILLTPAQATLAAPAEAFVGADITVTWTGPSYSGDYIGIGAADATGSAQWESFHYTADGDPASLVVPSEPGTYLVQYFTGQDRSVLATTTLQASAVGATVTPPTQAIAGETISVDWTGPNYDGDYIGIGAVDATGSSRWESFHYTENGAPASLLVPTEPGEYLVQYFLGLDRSILASAQMTVTPLKVRVTAPASAVAGSTIEVGYDGPNYDGDYIGIGLVGATGSSRWETFTYTNEGNPLTVQVPINAGDYEISYFAGQDRSKLFTQPLTVTAFTARLVGPPSAVAGSELIVGWDGPNYDGDYIGIGPVGATGSARWSAFAYTESGNPVTITLPETSGDYVIQYFTGQGRVSVATIPLTIE